jgi:hypothetical protein
VQAASLKDRPLDISIGQLAEKLTPNDACADTCDIGNGTRLK